MFFIYCEVADSKKYVTEVAKYKLRVLGDGLWILKHKNNAFLHAWSHLGILHFIKILLLGYIYLFEYSKCILNLQTAIDDRNYKG